MNKFILLTISLLCSQLSAQSTVSYIDNEWPDNRYLVHGDGTATDVNTGLVWMQCSLGQTYKLTNSGNGIDSYSSCDGSATSYSTWQEALSVAEEHGAGWRLPNYKELSSLVARDRYYPSINASVFPNTPYPTGSISEHGYWSSSPHTRANHAWVAYFKYGKVYFAAVDNAQDYPTYVRLVRSVRQ